MATTAAAAAAAPEGQLAWRYQKELPEDMAKLAKAWTLLETYSGIPPDDIASHVMEVVCSPCLSQVAVGAGVLHPHPPSPPHAHAV